MIPGAPSPWTVQQRRWLSALGHTVFRSGSGGAEAGNEPEPMAPPRAAAGPVAPTPSVVAASRMAAEPAAAVPPRAPAAPAHVPAGPAPASGRAGGMRRPAQMPDRLRLALLRASGLDPSDPAAQETMAQWPVERLRGDAAAKRAFWPQLRALRTRPS